VKTEPAIPSIARPRADRPAVADDDEVMLTTDLYEAEAPAPAPRSSSSTSSNSSTSSTSGTTGNNDSRLDRRPPAKETRPMDGTVTVERASPIRDAKRESLIAGLNKDYGWYRRWKSVNGFFWHVTQIAVIAGGFIAAILAAIGESEIPKFVLILVPCLSSVAAAMQIQFRFRDMQRLHDEGRIAIWELTHEAQMLPEDQARARQILENIMQKRLSLSRRQAMSYFRVSSKGEDVHSKFDTN
jgi:hypothetical protein